MFFGFFLENGKINEQIPSLFKSFRTQDRNKLFVILFNAVVQNELKIGFDLVKNENLLAIFHKKIHSLLNETYPSCEYSKNLINLFLSGRTDELRIDSKQPKHPAAKLIWMIYCKEIKGIYFKSKWLFSNYIYEKISAFHHDKEIFYQNDLILICKNGEKIAAIMPSFKYINTKDPHLADDEIQKACNFLKQNQVKNFYIAYPKHCDFKRHIEVQTSDLDAKIKLTPYVISNKIKYQKEKKWQ